MTGFASRLAVTLLAAAGLSSLAPGGEFNPDVNIGDKAPEWKDLPGVDGKSHSSSDIKDAKFVVVAFTCNSCPYAGDCEDRLVALAKSCKERSGVLVAINVNLIDEDLLPAMKEKAAEKKFIFPYLFDESQQIAKAFGARYTPEFFVLDSDRKIAYMGSLDDSPDGKKVSKRYVEDAIDAMLSKQPVRLTETVPIGCRIRFKRVRRTRKPAK